MEREGVLICRPSPAQASGQLRRLWHAAPNLVTPCLKKEDPAAGSEAAAMAVGGNQIRLVRVRESIEAKPLI